MSSKDAVGFERCGMKKSESAELPLQLVGEGGFRTTEVVEQQIYSLRRSLEFPIMKVWSWWNIRTPTC